MKSIISLLVVLLLLGCNNNKRDTIINLNEKHQWEIFLSGKWGELAEKERKEIMERGEKLVNKQKNIETGGFKELLMLNKGDSKLMAAIGEINEKRYGKYEEAREARANYYKSVLNQDITEEVTMDTVSIKLGDVTLKNYKIKARTEKIPVINKETIISLRIYEGKLNEDQFIIISTQTKDEEEDKELKEIIIDSKIVKMNEN